MITVFLESECHLAEFKFAYNMTYHTSLQATSAFLTFGREAQPINIMRGRHESAVEVAEVNSKNWRERMERIQVLRDWVVENLQVAHNKQAHYYNLLRREHRFVIGANSKAVACIVVRAEYFGKVSD